MFMVPFAALDCAVGGRVRAVRGTGRAADGQTLSLSLSLTALAYAVGM